MKFLDPKVLKNINGIEVKARMLVDGMYASRHRCPDYGASVEFVDHRDYVQGDDPRSIDWKMLARTEKYYIKRFEMESNMDVTCLLDVSGSMGYVTDDRNRLTKLEYASYLAASLAFLMGKQQDAAGLITFDTKMRDFLPPKQGQRHLFSILSCLNNIQAGGETDLEDVLKLVAQRLTRRGLVVLISDCYGNAERVIDGFKHVAGRGQEILVFHIVDDDEINFPFDTLTSFKDLESGQQVLSDPLFQRKNYIDRFERFRDEIEEGVAGFGADYRFASTSDPIEILLRDYLLYRKERYK
ncbi:MAG: DUF58 domain-containing protein [Lentisphaeria bacterium]|nr:DUF58 domain-containing protein [Lentisphaeria bacterium]